MWAPWVTGDVFFKMGKTGTGEGLRQGGGNLEFIGGINRFEIPTGQLCSLYPIGNSQGLPDFLSGSLFWAHWVSSPSLFQLLLPNRELQSIRQRKASEDKVCIALAPRLCGLQGLTHPSSKGCNSWLMILSSVNLSRYFL